ncbi:hypothetical protein FOL47_006182 [Perkinsus chesapeaki]|uniref:Uncharacterized protein n=1 Tax=Perkinsus chesapeaki TaxID=330153 RepID=A0A7J6LTV7_PERCH|nr:hypothetical protein FOL47_006182 [Perkinsus chesapeaki]
MSGQKFERVWPPSYIDLKCIFNLEFDGTSYEQYLAVMLAVVDSSVHYFTEDYVFQEKVPRWQEADKKELHPPSGTDRNRFDGVSPSIQELIRKVGDKYPLDMNFWRKYKSVPAMANVRDKDAILEILDNFAKIHRKHIYLFQRLKHTIVADMDHWNAPELAKVCASWAQLGFLTDRFTAEMSDRVVKTVGMCDTEALARLLDAYASTRTRHLRAPLKALAEASLAKIDLFSPQQLCLHCSSFARLNLAYEPIFDAIANRLCDSGEEALSVIAMAPEDSDPLAVLSVAAPGSIYSARDIALAAYSFGKLEGVDPTQQQQQQQQQTIIMGPTKGHQQEIANRAFDALAVLATLVLRDCTARELQMLATGFDRHRHHTPADQRKPFNSDLLRAMSTQAKRRIAQFSAESLVLFLRSFSNLCADSPDRDELMDVLLSRVSTHLPRAVATFKAIDLVTTLQVYARQGSKHSEVAGLLADSVVAKKSDLTPTDWVSVIHSVAAMNGPMSSVMKAARREGNDLIGKLKTPQLVTIITSCCGARYYRVDDLLPFIMELKSRTLHMPYASATDADTAAMIFIALSRMELPNNSSLDNSDVDDESRLLSLDNSLGLLAWLMPRLTSPGGGRPSAKLAEEVLECIADMDQADFREAAGGAEEVTCLAGEMLTAVRADSRGFSARPNSGAKRNSNFDYFSTDSSVGGDGNDDETLIRAAVIPGSFPKMLFFNGLLIIAFVYSSVAFTVPSGKYCSSVIEKYESQVVFTKDKIAVTLVGETATVAIFPTTYNLDKSSGLITIHAEELSRDAHKTFPFVEHMWMLKYDADEKEIHLHLRGGPAEYLTFTRRKCKSSSNLEGIMDHGFVRQLFDTPEVNGVFCSSVAQQLKYVTARFSFPAAVHNYSAILRSKGARVLLSNIKYKVGAAQGGTYRIFSEGIDDEPRIPEYPFLDYHMRLFYNGDLMMSDDDTHPTPLVFKPGKC